MTTRARVAFGVLAALALTGTTVRLVAASQERPGPALRPEAESAPAVDLDGSRVVYRVASTGSDNGRVAVVPLDDTDAPGARRLLDATCDRVDALRDSLVCLQSRSGPLGAFTAEVLGRQQASWPLPGIPSRTRLSPSGRLVADTVFVAGHTYLQNGFSTVTEIRGVDGTSLADLEIDFTLYVEGEEYHKRDLNFWGVTFEDDRHFYATASSSGTTWLVRGDLEEKTLTALRTNAECPSLSPDGTEVAYKKRVPERSDHWSIAVLDLATGRERVARERRSLDDQLEWLDADTLLYGLPRDGEPGVTDVWRIDTSDDAEPELFIPHAWSPAVVR